MTTAQEEAQQKAKELMGELSPLFLTLRGDAKWRQSRIKKAAIIACNEKIELLKTLRKEVGLDLAWVQEQLEVKTAIENL